ncbi:phosphatase PAP2 family protein [Candidatus Gracilibacteria bacterium]|nr:phosphatase PAP2 family protein [Candidatus Gracilibacteria bacterium]
MNIFLQINHAISEFLIGLVLTNNAQNFVKFFADSPIFFLPFFFVFYWIYYEKFYKTDKKFSQKIKNFFSKNEKISIKEKKNGLLLMVYSIIFGVSINLTIQLFFFFDRPELLITPILQHIPDASFPSDHSTVSFAFLFGLFFAGYKKIFWTFLPFVILMNTARIAGGVHWFFDILAGIIIGFFVVLTIFKNKNSKIIAKLNDFFINLAKFFKL